MHEKEFEKKKERKPVCAGCGKSENVGVNRPDWCASCWPASYNNGAKK